MVRSGIEGKKKVTRVTPKLLSYKWVDGNNIYSIGNRKIAVAGVMGGKRMPSSAYSPTEFRMCLRRNHVK